MNFIYLSIVAYFEANMQITSSSPLSYDLRREFWLGHLL